ncbi:uncharacterized protein SOCE26_011450 [Sorangium cellulosum]|uniref:Type IV secretion protein Rhs n=1 Tax=Sorangium cellulosum TaxID=56 RepID=A0A2L0EKC7_SORCE|nr:DUF6531 domain-containing protein [Sorangium cellulosum]AUX39750.1 uncharacterized protein SOCE26_011450 [Sorangium cellulosum]
MAHNFHDINGWLLVGLEVHQGFHIFPPAPMKFLKLVLLHPFTLGDKQKPTVLFNGVPSVAHQHEPKWLWPHLGIVPDPLDALTPLHIVFGSHKCWLPRGAVEICGEKATCCVIGGPLSLNADCWDIGKWPTSLVLNPGTVQTTPTFGDFAMGAVTLAIDLVVDLVFQGAFKLGGALLAKLGGRVLRPLFSRAKDIVGRGLRAATRAMGRAGSALGRGLRSAGNRAASALRAAKCFVTGHPVDATSGAVVDSKVDLSLPGAIRLVWERRYTSSRALDRTSLGRGGWTHGLDQWIAPDDEGITLRDEQGRDVYFPHIAPGESAFHRPDRLTLSARADGSFSVYSHGSRLTRHFAPAAPRGRALLRSIEDAHGNAITLEYAGERLQRVLDTAGREIRVKTSHGGRIARLEVWVGGSLEQWVDYTYTKMGELASAADALGHVERYGYDEDHRMVKTTLKNGVSFYYAYDPETGWCKKTWGDGGLHTVELRADLEKRITRLTGNEEPRVLYWNEDGLVVREETPDGLVIRVSEHDGDQYLIAAANGAGETTRYDHDPRGNKVREIDPAGNVTRWDYEDDLPIARVDGDGLVTKYEHDARGSLTKITHPSGLCYALSYDAQGHLRAIRGEDGILASFVVDRAHQVVEEVDERGARAAYVYDRLGRPVSRTDALGRVTAVSYDRLGRALVLQRPDGTTTRAAYDALGKPVRAVDALGHVTELEYSGTGVLAMLTQPGGRVWLLARDARERLRRVVNPKQEAHEFVYDAAGRVMEEKTFDGRVLRYRYSPSGRLARIDYPDGSFRAFAHDPLGNVVREDSADGPIHLHRDRMGRLLGGTVEQGGQRIETRLLRDALGRVIADTQGDRTLRYTVDARGRRVERVMPDGAMTRYAYAAADDVVRVEHDGYALLLERDALGRERARGDAGGRFSIHSEYDAADRIVGQRVFTRAPGEEAPRMTVERLSQYDRSGRVTTMDDGRWGATIYEHDSIGQLLEARRGSLRERFEYDAAGSMTKRLEGIEQRSIDDEQAPWTVAAGNLLVRTERASYGYDGRGRRVWKRVSGEGPEAERTGYAWDCRDRLREVMLPTGQRVAFTYDAFGRRVRKEVFDACGERLRTVEFLWDGDVIAADIDSRDGTRTFVHRPGTFSLLLQAEQGEVFVYVNDHVGLPRELVDPSGKVAWSAAYDAWGQAVSTLHDPARPAGRRPVESPFRLLGHYADEDTGLCHARFRDLDAEVGRWCSPDPLGISGSSNLFEFNGAPTTSVDPFGLTSDDWTRVFTATDFPVDVTRETYVTTRNIAALTPFGDQPAVAVDLYRHVSDVVPSSGVSRPLGVPRYVTQLEVPTSALQPDPHHRSPPNFRFPANTPDVRVTGVWEVEEIVATNHGLPVEVPTLRRIDTPC